MDTQTKDQAKWSMSSIYFEDRYDTPKVAFLMTLDMLTEHFDGRKGLSVLDVGTAEAAMPHFLLEERPDLKVVGIEFDPVLVELARKKVPACDTQQGDAQDLGRFAEGSFDVVTCHGVLSIFEDYRLCMGELLRVVKPGGLVLVNNMWNAFPVDLAITVRHATQGKQDSYDDWEAGWNMVSLATISEYCKHHDRVASFDFHKILLPLDLPRRPDNILRSWTQIGPDGERYHMNGIGRLLDKRVLRIRVRE